MSMSRIQAERQLILIGAGTAERRRAARERANLLMADISWPQLQRTLWRRKLLGTLGPRIAELSEEGASDDFLAGVEQVMEAGRRHGAYLQLVTLRLAATLADAGIHTTVLKGPTLGEAIYGDPGRRISSDIDLLVAKEQLSGAVEVMRGLGYNPHTDYVDKSGLPGLHFALRHERGELPPVELHWRIHWYECNFAAERLLPSVGARMGEWRPAPADELVALLLFYARDGFVDLRLATDVGAWWDAFGAGVGYGALTETLRAYPAFARVIPAAATVAERVVGLPARQVIGDASRLGLRGLMATRLADPNPRASSHQVFADTGLVDGLLAPPGGLSAFIRRKVVLPREILSEYAQITQDDRVKSTFGYGVRILARYGLALPRIVRGPERYVVSEGN